MREITGGVCAARGFRAGGVSCGIKNGSTKKDLALVVSDVVANTAAVYTQNLVFGAPIKVTRANLAKSGGKARAFLCNSGNANTCNEDGEAVANRMCELAAAELGVSASEIVVASTGVIGQKLDVSRVERGIAPLVAGLSASGSEEAAVAIMTTDLAQKTVAVEFEVGGKVCKMGGIAKGSGMIHPNMATMLCFVTTDCAVSVEALEVALKEATDVSFNMVSVDGDTSTNDMASVMANGLAGNSEVAVGTSEFVVFVEALKFVLTDLAKKIAKDGEGATKLLECVVSGASSEEVAKKVAKSVVCSSLVKTAMFGSDANWGRVLCAIGYAGVGVDVSGVGVWFVSPAGEVVVCENGAGVAFSEEVAKRVLSESEVQICVSLKDGTGEARAWGCDLSYEYVKINGDYRS